MSKREKKDPNYWINMAYSLDRQGKYDKAKRYYEKTLEVDPENLEALINLGKVLGQLENFDDALKYLLYATKVYPDVVEAWINLGAVYNKSGQYE